MTILRENIIKIVSCHFERGGGCVDGPDWEWDEEEADRLAQCIADELLKLLPEYR